MMTTKTVHRIGFLKALLQTLIFTLGLCGLSSHYHVTRRDKFYASKLMLFYSLLVTCTFTAIYGNEIYNDYMYGWDLSKVSKLYLHMNSLVCVICYITGILLRHQMPSLLNKMRLYETVDFLENNRDMTKRPIIVVVLLAILFPVATEVALIMHQSCNVPDRSALWTLYTLLPTIVAQIMPNCVYGAFELWKLYIAVLNKQLRDICNEVNYMQSGAQLQLQKPYYRMHRFCELADKLDVLAGKYLLVGEQSMEYLQLYALPYVCAIIRNLCGITMGFYMQYYVIAGTLINGNSFDVFNAIANGLLLTISIGEILFLAVLSNANFVMLRETALILQNINLTHADVRFKQSVDAFSFIAHTHKFKIKPLGLLEINIAIIHDVSGAVTSFLFILIQTDLALRFSFK